MNVSFWHHGPESHKSPTCTFLVALRRPGAVSKGATKPMEHIGQRSRLPVPVGSRGVQVILKILKLRYSTAFLQSNLLFLTACARHRASYFGYRMS